MQSAMEVTDGILIHIWELFSSFSFEKPGRFIISCVFKGPGWFCSFNKEHCCSSALSLSPVTVSDTLALFSFLIKLNYFLLFPTFSCFFLSQSSSGSYINISYSRFPFRISSSMSGAIFIQVQLLKFTHLQAVILNKH